MCETQGETLNTITTKCSSQELYSYLYTYNYIQYTAMKHLHSYS